MAFFHSLAAVDIKVSAPLGSPSGPKSPLETGNPDVGLFGKPELARAAPFTANPDAKAAQLSLETTLIPAPRSRPEPSSPPERV